MPSATQLSTKIRHSKSILYASREILMTVDLKDVIKENMEVPIEKNKMFVAFSEVVDMKAKAKLAERANPSSKPWDEKKKILTDCHFIDERKEDFFCDCFEGIKGRMCEHTPGMHYRNKTGKLPVSH